MPRGTVNTTDQERFELKSAPPNGPDDEQGYVILRRMSFGEFLKRRSFTSDMRIKGGKTQDDFEGIMQLLNENATQYEFATCIVDHNLTDDDGNKLDMRKPSTLQTLHPAIGEEISELIDKFNGTDQKTEAELGN